MYFLIHNNESNLLLNIVYISKYCLNSIKFKVATDKISNYSWDLCKKEMLETKNVFCK